ncbi:hypothetical protein NKH34_23025 [Mesorhizobium sp. M1148]|uniref:hypothetical protein n=1 Tax=unclassified Mesorhizobium TaxID=325217 RepID=UPI0003CE81D5|nr:MULTISPECIES: hypothetical protein [unclassified Mesorhizobium]ESX17943.1 hypothetical protein X766_17785 [Mesorhizobium sp. LSJC255A00]ESX27121.1 hypothetical protein X765_20860 [Mesorhizobium sp. LSHC440B00]ESX36491.1 hypothetical protein X763_15295 [Mesorhizobium sp. LSHC432A00]ESX40369.1 hypothetical protein X764_20790 [Mesorhizobium sp. LSHC440A00]ESX74582.1 hypothetical protein X757_17060 [Mesorhizobium sp. LSHC414A00]
MQDQDFTEIRLYGEVIISRERDIAPEFSDYDIDAPLRLDTAANLAFPDGTMGVKGFRKERDQGRLTTEMIANKEYTPWPRSSA